MREIAFGRAVRTARSHPHGAASDCGRDGLVR
jgi:hypothetical protein